MRSQVRVREVGREVEVSNFHWRLFLTDRVMGLKLQEGEGADPLITSSAATTTTTAS